MIKGVIIDFNGTLYLDHDLNRKSWEDAFNSVRPIGSNAKYDEVNRANTPNDYLVCKAIYNFFGIEHTNEMIANLSEAKEAEYKELALKFKRDKLMNGAEDFLNYLKNNNIPYCIASMAPKGNIDFYLDYLNLDRWFDYSNIVYDNGSYFEKNSQIIDAAKKMKVDLKDCLIIEDTSENIDLAIRHLGLKKFIYINTNRIEYKAKEIIQEINDFTELDYKIFNN